MEKTISNFVGTAYVSVGVIKAFNKVPNIVEVSQSSSGLSFFHAMTAKQARQLADALVAAAEEIEELEVAA